MSFFTVVILLAVCQSDMARGCCLVEYQEKNCTNGAPIETRNWPDNSKGHDICFEGTNFNATNETCQSNCTYLTSCDDKELLDEPDKYYVAGWKMDGKT